jgi:hypothetical protein
LVGLIGVVIALQTPKHIRGGWSHYIDASEPVDGNGTQNKPAIFLLLAHEL